VASGQWPVLLKKPPEIGGFVLRENQRLKPRSLGSIGTAEAVPFQVSASGRV
jgi:hypothetical protein